MTSQLDDPPDYETAVAFYKEHPDDEPFPNPIVVALNVPSESEVQHDSIQIAESRRTPLKRRLGNCLKSCFWKYPVAVRIDLLILLAFFSYEMALGGMKLNECPAIPIIPKFQLAAGVVRSIRTLLSLVPWYYKKYTGRDDDVKESRCLNFFQRMFSLGVLFLPLIEVFFMFSITFQSSDSSNDIYCDYLLYRFAYWLCIASMSLLGFAFFVGVLYVVRRAIRDCKDI